MMTNLQDQFNWTRINNDTNGNPRQVVHFLAFKPQNWDSEESGLFHYETALMLAKPIGGKKYHNRSYGGGVVFSSYNLNKEAENILLINGDGVEYTNKDTGKTHVFLKSECQNHKKQLKKWFKFRGVTYSLIVK